MPNDAPETDPKSNRGLTVRFGPLDPMVGFVDQGSSPTSKQTARMGMKGRSILWFDRMI
jgi:hypothetical protein